MIEATMEMARITAMVPRAYSTGMWYQLLMNIFTPIKLRIRLSPYFR